MKVHFYDLQTGLIRKQPFFGTEDLIAQNTPSGCGVVHGVTDATRQRVSTDSGVATLVPYEPPPPTAEETATREAALALERIEYLERKSMLPRPVRDLILSSSLTGPGRDKVQRIEDQIVALRARLTEDTQ